MKKIILSSVAIIAIAASYFVLENNSIPVVEKAKVAVKLSEKKIEPTLARVDISEKTENSAPCFEVKNKETGENLKTAGWMPKWGSQGYVMQKEGTNQDLEINVLKDNCQINILLKGPWELKDPNDREKGLVEHWVEYTGFAINGEDIIVEPQATWHNKPFRHSLTANKGNFFEVNLKWQSYEPTQK